MAKVIVSTDHHLTRIANGTPWGSLFYRLMGAKVSLSSRLFLRHIADFDLLTIRDNAIVGFDAYIELHQKTAVTLTFEPIVIDTAATLGARAIALRGSELSPYASIHELSMVLPGEPLSPTSVWGGLPAACYFEDRSIQHILTEVTAQNAIQQWIGNFLANAPAKVTSIPQAVGAQILARRLH